MTITQINKDVIYQISNGSDKAFAKLYGAYYSYLNAIAICYLFDKEAGAEIVDDVFLNIWEKRETLSYPIHQYLIRSVQNGCLNYIRMLKARQQVMNEYMYQFLSFQENYIHSTPVPLQHLEMQQTEEKIRLSVNKLPLRCKEVFEEYFYEGKKVNTIADEFGLTVSTVRVQLKNATDRLKAELNHLLFILF